MVWPVSSVGLSAKWAVDVIEHNKLFGAVSSLDHDRIFQRQLEHIDSGYFIVPNLSQIHFILVDDPPAIRYAPSLVT